MTDPRWIDTTRGLRAALSAVEGGPLALDVEADSSHHYPEKVCLVQLSFGGNDWLIDPLAGVDLAPLAERLADPRLRKILHGADYDVRILHRDYGLVIRGLFDTMVAARLVGEPAWGLAALLSRHIGVELDKRFQRADWSRRPLAPAMREYAAMDTRHLERLAAILERRLQELGRSDWAAEEFERVEGVRWDSSSDDEEAFRQVKGSGRLGPRELAVLRELFRLREAEARRRDRPPFMVLRDPVLVDLSRAQPQDEPALRAVPGLPDRWNTRRLAGELLAAVARGMRLADAECPPRRAPTRRRPPVDSRLRRARDELAVELGLDPGLVASRSVLEAIEDALRAGDDPWGVPALRRWQAELLLPRIVGGPEGGVFSGDRT